jgi:hypothetical protein
MKSGPRKYAAEPGVSEEETRTRGGEAKWNEFLEKDAEVYSQA